MTRYSKTEPHSVPAKNYKLVIKGRNVTDEEAKTCTYTVEYSPDGVNWSVLGTYTDDVQFVEQVEAPTTGDPGDETGESTNLPQ